MNSTAVVIKFNAICFSEIRYFNLNELAPLLKLEDMIFVNLQYGNCSEEIMHLQSHCDSEFINLDVDYYNDFLSVYYIMQNLDVIVSSGTTVLELAGLSGTETFVLTNHQYFKPRIQKNNRDVWFPNIKYIDGMTNLSKIDVVTKIAKNIEALNEINEST